MSADIPLTESVASPNTLASLLRWVGGALVLLAGATFMLQGVDNITAALRGWSVLGLMVLCAAIGLFTQRSFSDPKGARLLFGLAVLLVPVQFSQLGGVIHEVTAPGTAVEGALAALSQWLPATGSASLFALSVVVTLGLGVLVLSSGFRVLAGSSARSLTLVMLSFCALLLVPARDSLLGGGVLMLMGAGYFLALRWLGPRAAHLRTFEGRSALLLLALPLLIALARFGLHADSIPTYCALLLAAATAAVELPRRLLSANRVTSALSMLGLTAAACAWIVGGVFWMSGVNDAIALNCVLLPVIAYWLESSRWLTTGGPLVRFGAALWLLALTVGQLEAGTFGAAFAMLLAALAVFGWGVIRRYRDPAVAGLVLAVVAAAQCLQLSLVHVEFSGWLALAGAGLALVVLASILERHGRALLGRSQQAWQAVSAWR